MADEVDDRIVAIIFDNAKFEQKISETLSSLDKLQRSLDLSNSAKALSNIDTTQATTSLSSMASAVDNIQSKFSAMGVVGFTVISELTRSVLGFTKSSLGDTLDPIISGGRSRSQNIEQAKFQFRGLGMDVNMAMDSALKAVLGTAYGLDDAAKAAAQLGASGIKAGDQMTGALRGIAGSAAMTGSSFSEMAQIFTSSAGTGKVNNQDLMQFGTRGLNAAAAIAPILGKTEQQVHEMASEGTLDFATFAAAMDKAFGEHATKANETYTGALGNLHAALSRVGAAFFTPALENQRRLFNALSPAIDKVKTALEPLMAIFTFISAVKYDRIIAFISGLNFAPLVVTLKGFGDGIVSLVQTIEVLFNGLRMAFNGLFPHEGAANMLRITAAFQMLTTYLQHLVLKVLPSFVRVFAVVFGVVKIAYVLIKDLASLFIDLFAAMLPKHSDSGAINFFGLLARGLYVVEQAILRTGLPKLFEALRFVLMPVANVIGFVTTAITDFFGAVGRFSGMSSVTDQLAKMGAAFIAIGAIAKQAFEILFAGDFTHGPLAEDSKAAAVLFGVRDALVAIGSVAKQVFDILFRGDFTHGLLGEDSNLVAFLFTVRDALGAIGSTAANLFDIVKNKVISFFSPDEAKNLDTASKALGDFHDKMKLISTSAPNMKLPDFSPGAVDFSGLQKLTDIDFEGKVSGLKKFIQTIGDYISSLSDVLSGYADQLSGVGDKLQHALVKFFTGSEVVRTTSPFEAIMKIIQEVLYTGILLKIMSFLNDFDGLVKSASGIFGKLTDALKNFGTDTESVATKILKIAISLGLLAVSLKMLSDVPGDKLAAALAALTVGMSGLFAMLIGLDKMTKNEDATKKATESLIMLSIAMRLMAGAIKVLAGIDPAQLTAGLLAASLGVAGLAASTRLLNDSGGMSMVKAAAAIVGLSLALVIMAGAIKIFSLFDPKELAIGLAAATASIAALGYAASRIDAGTSLGGLGILLIAGALIVMADAVKKFGEMDFKTLVRGLGTIFIALSAITGIVSNVANAPGFLVASLALPIIAGALIVLGEAIKKIGEIKGGDLAKGLLGMFLALTMVVSATTAMTEALPGAAALLVTAFALGVLAEVIEKVGNLSLKTIAVGIGTLVVSLLLLAAAGIFLSAPLLALGVAMLVLGAGFALFGIGVGAVVAAFVYLVNSTNDHAKAFIGVLNYMADQLPKVLVTFVKSMAQSAMDIADSMTGIIDAVKTVVILLLQGIIDVIPQFIQTVDAIVTAILGFIANRLVDFVNMGFMILLALMNGLLDNIGEITITAIKIIAKLADTLADKMPTIIDAGIRLIMAFVGGLGARMGNVVSAAVDIILYFLAGLAGNALKLADGAATILTQFLEGLAKVIVNRADDIHKAGVDIAVAIVEGLVIGLVGKKNTDRVIQAVKDLANLLPDWAQKILGINSPSKVFQEIGGYVGEGLALGLDQNTAVQNSAVAAAERIVSAFSQTLAAMPNALDGMDELNPVITPVLDLTRVAVGAKGLQNMLGVAPISPNVSSDQARTISLDTQVSGDGTNAPNPEPTSVTFIQNNNSPKALSTKDLYRQTKSQIATAKEKLNIK